MFSTCSPIFCCLSARGLEVSLHFWQSWPTVWRLRTFAYDMSEVAVTQARAKVIIDKSFLHAIWSCKKLC